MATQPEHVTRQMHWSDSFRLKRLCGQALHPALLSSGFAVLGLVLVSRTGYGSWGWFLAAFGLCSLAITALPVTGFFLVDLLQRRAGECPSPEALRSRRVRMVVTFSEVGEAVRLWRESEADRLVVSSWYLTAEMARNAVCAGVPESCIVVEDQARDTEEQADRLRGIVGDDPFVLCTWTFHMPRALTILRWYGLRPIAAPTHRITGPGNVRQAFAPLGRGWTLTMYALHEYFGIVWFLLRSSLRLSPRDPSGSASGTMSHPEDRGGGE
jgi:uncharacterized SAM-binding protein YcdF (DUF218 family)